MTKMRKTIVALGGACALALSGQAAAGTIIGGLEVDPNSDLVNITVASVFENVITGNGQTLSGTGEVTSIDGVLISSLCAGCELTYRFGGFVSKNFTGTAVEFDFGWVNFYLDYSPDFNPLLSPNSATDLAAATDGTLFLTLSGHVDDITPVTPGPAGDAVLFATGASFGTGSDTGTGTGMLDVDLTGTANGNTAGGGAIANAFFNTNSIADNLGGFADFQFGSSFSNVLVPHPSECTGSPPTGPECLAGSADLRGRVQQIPEPLTLLLVGTGLFGIGATLRRRT